MKTIEFQLNAQQIESLILSDKNFRDQVIQKLLDSIGSTVTFESFVCGIIRAAGQNKLAAIKELRAASMDPERRALFDDIPRECMYNGCLTLLGAKRTIEKYWDTAQH